MTARSDVMVVFDCMCGEVLARSLAVIDDDHIVQDDSKLVARCPACQMYRRADSWDEIDHPTDDYWYRLRLDGGDVPPIDATNPFVRLVDADSSPQSATATTSPTHSSEPETPPDCEDCGLQLGDADRRTGPDAPEIGWTYYECPACDGLSRPA